jgi:hypothetical protein
MSIVIFSLATVIKQKTIYEYDRIDLKEHYKFEIQSGSAIIFVPQETCQMYKSCEQCASANITFEVRKIFFGELLQMLLQSQRQTFF